MGLKMKLGIIVLFALLALSPARAYAATVSDISKQFICQCGCNMVLLNCSHAECESRTAMTALITEKLDQGQSEAQITQFFVSQYGEQVLASPPKKGFNLTAWILPFAVILFGGLVIYVAVKKWVRRGQENLATSTVEAGEWDEKYRRQLEEELAEFAERSFR